MPLSPPPTSPALRPRDSLSPTSSPSRRPSGSPSPDKRSPSPSLLPRPYTSTPPPSIQARRGTSLGLGLALSPGSGGSGSASASGSSRAGSRATSPGGPGGPGGANFFSSASTTSTSSHILAAPAPRAPHSQSYSHSRSRNSSVSNTNYGQRPSLNHLASFLSGIEHHTRVRYPGAEGGRGVSRSVSRSQSRNGERRDSAHGGEEDLFGDGWEGSASGRGSSVASGSRRSSASFSAAGGYGTEMGMPIHHRQGEEEDEEEGGTTFKESAQWGWGESTPSTTITAHHRIWSHRTPRFALPPDPPRVYSTETGEEPYLDTAPSSPSLADQLRSLPQIHPIHDSPDRRTKTHDSYASGLENVDVFDEGERVGVGVYLEGRGGWARDCFEGGAEKGAGSVLGELEVVRRLGEGTYAIVYLVREVIFDPEPSESTLSPLDAFSFPPLPDISTSLAPVTAVDPLTPHSNSNSTNNHMQSPRRPRIESWSSDPFTPPQCSIYGRQFALKCLCKKDLTDDLIEVQRGEAVLHRMLPEHEYIVQLYAAFETDDWLFLVLEYCPGQDLFYWLDERQDDSDNLYDVRSESISSSPSRSNSTSHRLPLPVSLPPPRFPPTPLDDDESLLSRTVTSSGESDHTPPSPTLLSSTANASLLSRKRLRLISRMFSQMCEAVQACHHVGIAHRDIKPENFIVVDERGESSASGGGGVVVKITDWGLGTREDECEDFDCGSKPYMAYECRNNLKPTYDPRQADIWSLGLVLLNLLYHRNPWADPSLDDPDFLEYVRNPRGFLQDRFEGIGEEVAGFLADRVFCDVLEMENGKLRKRVSAGEFGKWAGRLFIMMGEGKRKRASVSEATFSLFTNGQRYVSASNSGSTTAASTSTTTPQSSLLTQSAPHLPPISTSSASLTAAFVTSPSQSHDSFIASPLSGSEFVHELPKVDEVDEEKSFVSNASSVTISHHSPLPPPLEFRREFPDDDDDSPLPSPSFPEDLPLPKMSPAPEIVALPDPDPTPESTSTALLSPSSPLPSPTTSSPSPSPLTSPTSDCDSPPIEDENDEPGAVRCWGEPETVNPKSKRRKRGARKGKSSRASTGTSPTTTAPLSPSSPLTGPSLDQQRDQVLAGLAAASQDLARELSKKTRSFGTQSASASLAPSSSLAVNPSVPALTTKKSTGMFSRMRSLVADGNPDLLAFKARVEERNASMGEKADTYSAPGMMQGRGGRSAGSIESSFTSNRSVGTTSWGSGRSGVPEAEEPRRGRTGGESSGSAHWTSASSRRERLDQQHRNTRPGDVSPSSSSTWNGTLSPPGFDSRNHTPLSSFSSVGDESGVGFSSAAARERDWRMPSASPGPSHRSYSVTRPALTASRLSDPSSSSITTVKYPSPSRASGIRPVVPPFGAAAATARPKFKDVAVDTHDLNSAPFLASSLFSYPAASRPITIPSPAHTTTSSSADTLPANMESISIVTSTATPTATATANVKISEQPAGGRKLSKMLQSMSVFNRGQEKGSRIV